MEKRKHSYWLDLKAEIKRTSKLCEQYKKEQQQQQQSNGYGTPLKLNRQEDQFQFVRDKDDDGLQLFKIPIKLERYFLKLVVIVIDNFLNIIFVLPIRLLYILISLIFFRKTLTPLDKSYIMNFFLVAIPLFIMHDDITNRTFDISWLYHAIKSQSTLKLYGVLMTLEILDRIQYSFGEFLILDLWWGNVSKGISVTYFIAGVIYVFIHSVTVYLLIVVYNVTFNSDINMFIIMIFVNNSMKLKSSVFKKFNNQAYFQQTHIDLRGRTQKIIFVVLMIIMSGQGFAEDIFTKLTVLFASEIIVENVKHICVARMNNLNSKILDHLAMNLKEFLCVVKIFDILQYVPQELLSYLKDTNDLHISQNSAADYSFKTGFKINFVVFPYAVIALKILIPFIISQDIYTQILIFISLCVCKLINNSLLYLLQRRSANNGFIDKIYYLVMDNIGQILASSEEKDHIISIGALLMALLVLGAYMIFGSFAEHKEIKFIHETGFGIILGMIIGVIFVFSDPEFYQQAMSFNPNLFMLVILPPIIFAGGYNLKKRRFFQNFFYIALFGLVGTIVNFGIVSGLTIMMNETGMIRRYSDFKQEIKFTTGQILIYSATICATDSVAALTMIKPEKYPKLFSVIFGEGMVNDSVSIILFQTVSRLFPIEGSPKEFFWYTIFQILGEFLLNAIGAILFGLITGLGGSMVLKYMRFISHNPVIETGIVFIFGYIAYMLAELLEWSGVIAILVSGISMSHYLFYNLSSKGRVTTGITFNFLSLIAESFLYVYLGVSVFENKAPKGDSDEIAWSWTFVVCQIVVLFIARSASVFGTSLIAYLCKKKGTFRLNKYELGIICYAGIIRGAIAFALIQSLPNYKPQLIQIQVLKSSTLFLVIFTTVILGGTMPLFISWSMKRMNNSANIRLSTGLEEGRQKSEVQEKLLQGESSQDRVYKSSTQKWHKGLDERFFKRWFIYDYENRKEQISKEKKLKRQMEENPDLYIAQSIVGELEAQSRKQSMHQLLSQEDLEESKQQKVNDELEEQQQKDGDEESKQLSKQISFSISKPDNKQSGSKVNSNVNVSLNKTHSEID